MDEFDYSLWAGRFIVTQVAGGGGTVRLQFIANERMVVLFGTIGQDDYAANRTITVWLGDGTNIIGKVMEPLALDNVRIPFPVTGEGAAITANAANEFGRVVVLGKGDVMYVTAADLANTETLTVVIRALIREWPPTVNTTGSSGTVTLTTTYNKVI